MVLNMKNENKISNDSKQNETKGIVGLTEPWSTAVRIIINQGLAIFLVLYYLFVLRPCEDARYDTFIESIITLSESISQLKDTFNVSINRLDKSVYQLNEIIAKEEALLTENQTMYLRRLYIAAVINKLDNVIYTKLKNNVSIEELSDTIRNIMLKLADFIDQGLIEKEKEPQAIFFTKIYDDLYARIKDDEGCSRIISEDATKKWRNLEPDQITEELEKTLSESFELWYKPDN